MTSGGILKEGCDDATKSFCNEDQVDSVLSVSEGGYFLTRFPSRSSFSRYGQCGDQRCLAYRAMRPSTGDLHKTSPVLHRPSRQRSGQQICRVPVRPIFRGFPLWYRIEQRGLQVFESTTRRVTCDHSNRVQCGMPQTRADLSSLQGQWRAAWRHILRRER